MRYRVRVHAFGQVVAFDIPLSLLKEESDGNCIMPQQTTQLLRDALSTLNSYVSTTKEIEWDASDNTRIVDQWQIRRAITTRLPRDIAIRSVRIWIGPDPFEARKGVGSKTYTYKLRFRHLSADSCSAHLQSVDSHNMQQCNSGVTDESRAHPICDAGPHLLRRIDDQNTVWICPWSLDPKLLERACELFVGQHNFFNFVHKDERKKADNPNNNDRPAYDVDLFEFRVDIRADKEEDPTLPPVMNATFCLRAEGFKRSMIRNLVGFVVDVARGKCNLGDIPALLIGKESKSSASVNSAPACGLCLAKVEYKQNNFL